jgi:superfamily I DNA and/or RNA helicase
LFMERTRRMHPDITQFTSEVFYEDRLGGIPGLERQTVLGDGYLTGSGLRFVGVEHQGNANSSPEEAEEIVGIVRDLVRRQWRDREDRVHPIDSDNVLVLTPFNAQIREIREAFERHGERAPKVGTVDKFQGRQAPAVVYSMASSSAEDAPRGLEFLYDLHRLNVATSRAQCLAVIVGSPELIRVYARTPHQMRLVNALCRFLERSGERPPPSEGA